MISFDQARELVEQELRLIFAEEIIDPSHYFEDDEYFHIPVVFPEDSSRIGAPNYLVRKSDGKVLTPAFHPFTPLGKRMMNMTRVDLN